MGSNVVFMNRAAGVDFQVLVAVKAMVKRVKRPEGQTEIKEKMDRVE